MKQLFALLLVLLTACAHFSPGSASAEGSSDRAPSHRNYAVDQDVDKIELTDHHVHIFSAEVRRWLEKELDLPPLPPRGLDELMAAIRQDGVVKAAVLSNAYFFAHDTTKQPHDLQNFRAENDRIAAAIEKNRDRLVGFFSVDPLADSAFDEIERCARRKVFAGMKLHFANSEVDLRNPAHVERLGEIFARANALGLGIVVHLRTQRANYGREDAQIFIDQVLTKAPDVSIQIAHLGGWGGYDHATDGALSAFVDRASGLRPESDHVYFDISAVVRAVRDDGERPKTSGAIGSGEKDWWPEQRYQRLVERLRKMGLEHVLFGTDWPEWTPRTYAADLKGSLPLKTDELRTLLSNRAPWLR